MLSKFPFEKYPLPGGEVTIWAPGGGVLVTKVTGRLSLMGAVAMDVAFQRMREEASTYRGFHDWADMTDYEVSAFARLTQCSMRVVNQIFDAHFLVHSKVVDLGVNTANLLLKKVTIHRDPTRFHAKLESALPRNSGSRIVDQLTLLSRQSKDRALALQA